MVEGHGEHVEPDEDHDEDVELFVAHELEDPVLQLPLFKKTLKRLNHFKKKKTKGYVFLSKHTAEEVEVANLPRSNHRLQI